MNFLLKTMTSLWLLGWLTFHAQAQISSKNPTVKGNNQFALELYKKLIQENPSNVFLSPYSISSALAMTYAGAKTTTAREMAKTLHFPANSLHQDIKNLTTNFKQLNQKGLQLSVANALWGEKTQKFSPQFLQLNRTYYQAKLENLNFKKHPEKSRLIINKWIENKTRKKIKNLIPRGLIDANTSLVLTNAICFKGNWQYTFRKRQTQKMDFLVGNQCFPGIKFMRMTRNFRYRENALLQAIEIPYQGNKMQMLVLLPKDKNGLKAIEKSLSVKNYQKLMDGMFSTKVALSLPKFKMTVKTRLKRSLKQMGMPGAFSNQADFSGMTRSSILKISELVHKAFVEVSEKGTEAAATAVVMTTKSRTSHRSSTPPKIFKADHPFIFIIKDVRTGSILFMGRMTNPTEAS